MKLYFSPGACSLSPHIVLEELGVPYETEKVDLRAKTTESGKDFRTINPKGYVPTLELDDGSFLTEGLAIVQYLGDKKPELKLAPAAGTINRYRLEEWLAFVSSELHKGFSPLFSPTITDEYKAQVTERLTGRFAWVNGQLEGKQYLMGDTFTVADAYLFVIERWATAKKIPMGTHVEAHFERMKARPKVNAVMLAEGLIKT